jgi:hypothetical protein
MQTRVGEAKASRQPIRNFGAKRGGVFVCVLATYLVVVVDRTVIWQHKVFEVGTKVPTFADTILKLVCVQHYHLLHVAVLTCLTTLCY